MKQVELSCEWGEIKSNIMLENYAEKNRIYNALMNEANFDIRARHHGYHRPMILPPQAQERMGGGVGDEINMNNRNPANPADPAV